MIKTWSVEGRSSQFNIEIANKRKIEYQNETPQRRRTIDQLNFPHFPGLQLVKEKIFPFNPRSGYINPSLRLIYLWIATIKINSLPQVERKRLTTHFSLELCNGTVSELEIIDRKIMIVKLIT